MTSLWYQYHFCHVNENQNKIGCFINDQVSLYSEDKFQTQHWKCFVFWPAFFKPDWHANLQFYFREVQHLTCNYIGVLLEVYRVFFQPSRFRKTEASFSTFLMIRKFWVTASLLHLSGRSFPLKFLANTPINHNQRSLTKFKEDLTSRGMIALHNSINKICFAWNLM